MYKTFTRSTPNGIMDGCIRKVNQKVNRQIDSSFETICMKCQIMFYGKIPAKFWHAGHEAAPVLLIDNNKLRRSTLQPS